MMVYFLWRGEYALTISKFEIKDDFLMVTITKDEAAIIREKMPRVHIRRTMAQKSHRHHYWCEETRAVKNLLYKLRHRKGGADGTTKKTR